MARKSGLRKPGDTNKNGQTLVRKTNERGNHPAALVWVLRCEAGNHEYGANSCDFHVRKCPIHQGGKPGLPIP